MSKFMKLNVLDFEKRIKNAKSKVDNKSPMVESNNFLGMSKLREDATNYMSLMKRNMQLLVNLNSTMRTLGSINTFRNPILVPNNVSVRQLQVKAIEKDNLRLGLRLLAARRTLNTKPDKRAGTRSKGHSTSKRDVSCPLDRNLLLKYEHPIEIPSNADLCRRVFRPTIFFDLEIKNVRPLGRVVIEMYTEAAPQVVLQFLNMCQHNDTQRFQFTRIFPSLWMEGKLKIEEDHQISCGLIEYDMRALSNDKCGGIFSFQMNEKHTGCFFVSISFKPLAVVNGKRVAFARIKKGFRIIHCLQDLGTRNGKMTKKIVVVNCGHLL